VLSKGPIWPGNIKIRVHGFKQRIFYYFSWSIAPVGPNSSLFFSHNLFPVLFQYYFEDLFWPSAGGRSDDRGSLLSCWSLFIDFSTFKPIFSVSGISTSTKQRIKWKNHEFLRPYILGRATKLFEPSKGLRHFIISLLHSYTMDSTIAYFSLLAKFNFASKCLFLWTPSLGMYFNRVTFDTLSYRFHWLFSTLEKWENIIQIETNLATHEATTIVATSHEDVWIPFG